MLKSFIDGQLFIWTLLIDQSSHKAHSTLVFNIFFSILMLKYGLYMDFWDLDFCCFIYEYNMAFGICLKQLGRFLVIGVHYN
jgi:hypothetical protein